MNEKDFEKAMEEREGKIDLGRVVLPHQQEREQMIAKNEEAIEKSGYRPTQNIRLVTELGFSNIPMEALPSKGRFYPKDAILQIRSATVREIEHYSTMNDNDPIDIDNHLNDILKSCTVLKCPSDSHLNCMDLIEGDRLFVILSIKDKTFTETENVISFDIVCPKGHNNKRTLTNNILNTNPEGDESIEKYYDESKRCYVIKTKRFGEIPMRPARIGLVSYIYERGRDSEMKGKYWNKSYYSILPFIFPNSSGAVKDSEIDSLEAEFDKWDKTKFAVVYRMAEQIKVGIDPFIEIKCDECGEVARSPFRIPNGPKALFVISNIDDELL